MRQDTSLRVEVRGYGCSVPRRVGYGRCRYCDQVIAVYLLRDGTAAVFRHGAEGLMGAFHRWPNCEGSNTPAREARDMGGEPLRVRDV